MDQELSNIEVLVLAKYLVNKDYFDLVPRRSRESTPVNTATAKYLFSKLQPTDFRSYEEDRDRHGTFLWIYHENDDDIIYYIKFKFLTYNEAIEEGHSEMFASEPLTRYVWVKFISFHPSRYQN